MEIKIIRIEDLEKGDEIIIPHSSSGFKYLKILKTPEFGNKKHWKTGDPLYKAVRCSLRIKQKIYNQGTKWERKRIEKIFESNVENHNATLSIDLTGKDLMLIKREIYLKSKEVLINLGIIKN